MATAVNTQNADPVDLANDLRAFLESDQHKEHKDLRSLKARVEEIRAAIIGLSNEGTIGHQNTFPPENISKAQKYVVELQEKIEKILNIHALVAQRWAGSKITEREDPDTVWGVTVTVLLEYQQRWS